MAATIARAIGADNTRTKTTTRLGAKYAEAQANTWRTFATITTWADGSVAIEVKRDGEALAALKIGPEGKERGVS